jgi:hypothetical protein
MNFIQLGIQEAPSSIAPNFRISVAMVCITELGMLTKLTEVKVSGPPSQSS